MRTTLLIDDELVRLLKKHAARQGKTMGEVVEEALRRALLPGRKGRQVFKLDWRTTRGRLIPGVDIADRDSLYERIR